MSRIPELGNDELREFVLGYCDGHIWTSFDVPPDVLGLVFMPVSFGALSEWSKEELEDELGCVWASTTTHKTSGMAVNGYPTFVSCSMLSVADWDRAKKAIEVEMARRKEIGV